MDVVGIFNLQVVTWLKRMNHPVNSIAIFNLLLLFVSQWNARKAILIHNNDIIRGVHQCFNWWFPKLVHFKPVLDQTIMNVNHKYDELVAIHGLIANNYFSFLFHYSLKVFSFQVYNIQCSITNFKTVYPPDDELGLDSWVRLLYVEL